MFPIQNFSTLHTQDSGNPRQPQHLCTGTAIVAFFSINLVWMFREGHNIWKNLPLSIWRYSLVSNFMWQIFSNFVPFSEVPNFTSMVLPVQPIAVYWHLMWINTFAFNDGISLTSNFDFQCHHIILTKFTSDEPGGKIKVARLVLLKRWDWQVLISL